MGRRRDRLIRRFDIALAQQYSYASIMKFHQGWSRREWLLGVTAGLTVRQLAFGAQTPVKSERNKLSMPGLYPGKVVAVSHPGCLLNGEFQAEPVRSMIDEGMLELTGAEDLPEAWKLFFERGDVVGIKVCPVGGQKLIGSAHAVRRMIEGLLSAGVRKRDIVVYDRYRAQFLRMGFDEWLPEGVRWSSATLDYDGIQQGIEGYDPDHYMDMAVTLPGYDVNNLTARRSYAANFITKEVNKLINYPVLKTHQSAGVTLALKNLSHGLVNNVCRSHGTSTLNVCGAFIPAVVAMPVIRDKTVLHILDGVRGLFDGGPGGRPEFTWEHRKMYFATDPVSLDRVCWNEIDQKRLSAGLKPIAEAGPDRFSTFLNRQPEHIEIAGAMGLGIWDERRIKIVPVDLRA